MSTALDDARSLGSSSRRSGRFLGSSVLWLSCFLGCVQPAGGLEPLQAQLAATQRRPNIVVLFADDAGFADFGFQAHADPDLALLTPHIDRIASEGVLLTDFHTSGSVCSPSRAGLLTGRYQQAFGHEQNLPVGSLAGGIASAGRSLAERVRAAGLATGYVGKWHLGYRPEDHPNETGWDWYYGCLQGSRPYLPLEDPSPWRVLQENGAPTPEGGYVTDRLGDAAVRFIEDHASEPFFLFVSFTAPHGPLQPRPGDLEQPALARIEKERRRKYAGLVKALDDNVGKVLATLEKRGLVDDTLVLFTNDNGGQTQTGARNTPLRGRKGQLFEGGIRVPFAARWPGVIAPGTVCREPSIALDLAPTLLEVAGSEERSDPLLDGISLLASWTGARPEPPPRHLFWRQAGSNGPRAVRAGRWKLVQNDRDAAPQLFDLVHDLAESTDVAAQHPDVVTRLVQRADAWEAGLVEPRWGVEGATAR